jgi:CheY-like chemotaxis protein
MPSGGTLTFAVANAQLGEGEIDRLPPGRYVRLTVTDDGCGMDEETQRRIFEPFFTTKPVGKGTGLGLSTVYGIVAQSGGAVKVKSAPGRGTSFEIYLPESVEEAEAPEVRPAAARGGSETVLLVEDDEALRKTLQRSLTRLGYTVHPAKDGAEAARVFLQCGRSPALVITDVVLPDQNGLEVVEHLRAASFNGKVIFMTGYVDRPELRELLGKTGAPILHKPFSREVLIHSLREVLDGSRTVEV